MSGLLYGQTSTGEMVPVQVNSAGQLVISGTVGGPAGGTSDTLETTQKQVRDAVQSLDAKTPAAGAAQPISAVALPLPVGAATATNQAAGNASLASIDTKTPPLQGGAVPVVASARGCVGRQTIALAAGVVTTLTVPGGAVAANIQADGNSVRVTQDGTAPSATVGTRIDDGVIYPVDTSLASVKLFVVVACSVQVCYFDKA